MSRGSPILQLRVSEDFVLALDVIIAEMNKRRKTKHVTRTSFIWAALQEKIRHMERSKKTRRCITPPPPSEDELPTVTRLMGELNITPDPDAEMTPGRPQD
jgi:hypothetical protein